MGLFDKLVKGLGEFATGVVDGMINNSPTLTTYAVNHLKAAQTPATQSERIVLSPSSRIVKHDFLDNVVSFRLNDAFRPAQSHAGEVSMLFTYAPGKEYGDEGSFPYIAIQEDDVIYNAVSEFEENGKVKNAIEMQALSGKFLFKAKKNYYNDIIYFYGFSDDNGFFEKAGLCVVYQKEYVGTDDEKKLMQALDEAAASFEETKTAVAD